MKKLGLGLLIVLTVLGTFTSCEDPNSELLENTVNDAPYNTGGEEDEDDPVSSGGGSGG